MWCVRVYRNSNTKNILGATLFDEITCKSCTLDKSDIKRLIRNNGNNFIHNLKLDDSSKLQLKKMTINKSSHYGVTYTGNTEIRHFCIITKYNTRLGTLDWIASKDSDSDIIINKYNSTYSELENILGKNVQLYNGFIDKDNSLAVYDRDNSYVNLGRLNEKPIEKNSKNWIIHYAYNKNAVPIVDYIETRKNVGEATLPYGIDYIKKFNGGVNNLTLPDSITRLGKECFEELVDLQSIKIGKGIKIIPESCFYGCEHLKTVRFSGSEEIIEVSAFEDCINLKETIVTNARVIEEQAFSDSGITIVKLLRCGSIGRQAFGFCKNLRKVTLNDGLKHIGNEAFIGCDKLTEIYIPDSVEYIGNFAFRDCKQLLTASVPRTAEISKTAFMKRCEITVR